MTPLKLLSIRFSLATHEPQGLRRAAIARKVLAIFWIGLLLQVGTCLGPVSAVHAEDSQSQASSSATDDSSDQPRVIDYESSVRDQVASISDDDVPRHHTIEMPSILHLLEGTIAALLLWHLMAPHFGAYLCRFDPWAAIAGTIAEQLAENRTFEAFANRFREGPAQSQKRLTAAEHAAAIRPAKTEPEPDPMEPVYRKAHEEIANLRKLFSRLGWASEEAEKRGIFEELASRTRGFMEIANLLESKPLWQVSATLEGLLKLLAGKPEKLTPSCLRTAVSSLDLLTELAVSGIRSTLTTEPPVRILAVDDDAVSRFAVSSSLKQVFGAPELAVDGPSALKAAAGQKFDMIFLDVEMPGMNGFELCAKFRQSPEHERIPVVFVTSHSDFNSRAQLPLAGAQDLIAKPFMSFEVTLKALIYVLRGRLAEDRKPAEASEKNSAPAAKSSATAPENKLVQPELVGLPSQALAPG